MNRSVLATGAGPRAAATALILAVASGCGPSQPPPAPTGATSVPTPEAGAVTPQQLSQWSVSPPLKWILAEGVAASSAAEDAKTSGKALYLTPLPSAGLHRVAVAGQFGGAKRYHVNVWLKATPGVGAMLEARGQAVQPDQLQYAVQFFDLDKTALQPNPLTTDKSRFVAPGIVQDGPWKKLSVDFSTRDGWIYVVVGMTLGGKHTFAGVPGAGLTVRGMEITPKG